MSLNELLEKYDKHTGEWMNLEYKLTNYLNKWLRGEVKHTPEEMQDIFDGVNRQIQEIKIKAESVLEDFKTKKREEAAQSNLSRIVDGKYKMIENEFEKKKRNSNNDKELKQKEVERQRQINNIINRLLKGEINMQEAYKYKEIVDETYGIVDSEKLEEEVRGLLGL